ncbi:protein yippee-like At3g08990 isoform X1 [Brassica napus]|uniref:protein yippee-like At3g08990 isoform X1 n=2 Tax=Brassica napus TaxID=3708 RepID=UPI00207877E1|nr:protein yippee-like At3g08990 isoform X1 [Brassica napus]XP_048631468.1 protein yippee-like At3g08990 isoform X1 [Brassica napus]
MIVLLSSLLPCFSYRFKPSLDSITIRLVEMGRMFEIELEGPFYTCIKCHTHLGLPNDIISKEIDQFGRYEYEFTRLFNTFLGERPFNSAVKDIFCVGCSNIIGIYGVTGGSYWVLRNELHGPEGSDDEV